jgi:hypothetical protein
MYVKYGFLNKKARGKQDRWNNYQRDIIKRAAPQHNLFWRSHQVRGVCVMRVAPPARAQMLAMEIHACALSRANTRTHIAPLAQRYIEFVPTVSARPLKT